ncbi:hypothetical protein EIP91_005639 [Steccherinum ochraceum]|uniref:Uncharacterized protein n=1 Tax=Steccherinum ochraceum TaxID=92696 RepID=A0A4R0R702_9APHY|nr:hypothetical protein EIP91_005639 [Steccherinum ochraceum]
MSCSGQRSAEAAEHLREAFRASGRQAWFPGSSNDQPANVPLQAPAPPSRLTGRNAVVRALPAFPSWNQVMSLYYDNPGSEKATNEGVETFLNSARAERGYEYARKSAFFQTAHTYGWYEKRTDGVKHWNPAWEKTKELLSPSVKTVDTTQLWHSSDDQFLLPYTAHHSEMTAVNGLVRWNDGISFIERREDSNTSFHSARSSRKSSVCAQVKEFKRHPVDQMASMKYFLAEDYAHKNPLFEGRCIEHWYHQWYPAGWGNARKLQGSLALQDPEMTNDQWVRQVQNLHKIVTSPTSSYVELCNPALYETLKTSFTRGDWVKQELQDAGVDVSTLG